MEFKVKIFFVLIGTNHKARTLVVGFPIKMFIYTVVEIELFPDN